MKFFLFGTLKFLIAFCSQKYYFLKILILYLVYNTMITLLSLQCVYPCRVSVAQVLLEQDVQLVPAAGARYAACKIVAKT